MAAGVPVVASRLGGITELVDDGRTGFLVAPDDDRGFVAAVDRLLADRSMRAAFGDAARSRYARDHRGSMAGRLVDELQGLIHLEA